jgi:hypothetical protein
MNKVMEFIIKLINNYANHLKILNKKGTKGIVIIILEITILVSILVFFKTCVGNSLKPGQELTARITTSFAAEDSISRHLTKKYLRSIRAYKNEKGNLILVIGFDPTVKTYGRIQVPGMSKLLIRLFDKNGNYITHFYSEDLIYMFVKQAGGSVEIDANNQAILTYDLNMMVLRETKYLEIGISTPIWR